MVLAAVAGGPKPTELEAATWKLYMVCASRPETVALVASEPTTTVTPPGLAVTTYPVIGRPPVEDGAVHETVASSPLDASTDVTAVGAPGAVGVWASARAGNPT